MTLNRLPTPSARFQSYIPRIRARSASLYGWFWRAHIRRALSSRDLNSRRGGTTAPGQIGMKRRHHLRALSDGGGDALDRTRAYVADGEHARAIRFQCVTFFAANFTRADKPLFI